MNKYIAVKRHPGKDAYSAGITIEANSKEEALEQAALFLKVKEDQIVIIEEGDLQSITHG